MYSGIDTDSDIRQSTLRSRAICAFSMLCVIEIDSENPLHYGLFSQRDDATVAPAALIQILLMNLHFLNKRIIHVLGVTGLIPFVLLTLACWLISTG